MRGTFKLEEGCTCRMPASLKHYPCDPNVRVVYDDCRCISVTQRTDDAALAALIPEEFEILSPVVYWQYCNCRGVDFMMMGEYRILQASVPVRYLGNGGPAEGVYPLMILENNAVPVLGGREEDGMPKSVCDISVDRHFGKEWFAAAAENCETVARVRFTEEEPLSPARVEALNRRGPVNAFGNRCLPYPDRPGLAYHDYILYPQESTVKRGFTGKGEISVCPPDAWYVQPYLASMLYPLSQLPKLGYENASRTECSLRLCVSDSRVLM